MKRKVCTGFSCPEGNKYWKHTGPILDELCPACDRPLREIEPTHGGKRDGAGRPPRTDGRTKQIIVIMATDAEAQTIRQMTTDERRKALLAATTGHEAEETE